MIGAVPIGSVGVSLTVLRTNAVLRWEFSPGSTLFLVWQQNRSDRVNRGALNVGDAFGDVFTSPGTNVLAMKVAYWVGK